MRSRAAAASLLAIALAAVAPAMRGAGLPVETIELENGMTFLLLARPLMPTVEAGWVVSAGAAEEGAGATGVSHLAEHMMFKGTSTIGAIDAVAERAVLDELDRVEGALRAAPTTGRRAPRRRAELERRRLELERRASSLARLGAFSLEYSRAGATRINANTAQDFTVYYATVPAERIELWFWLESDRLLDPVLRELAKEKRVIAEERRMRIESTPAGAADLAFDAAFWRGTGYGHSTLGSLDDVERSTRSDVRALLERYYRPANLTAVLIGGFDPDRAAALARAYFGRLEAGGTTVRKPVVPLDRTREERLDLECECPSKVRVRYLTVPFDDADRLPLQILAGLLNGRSGRLYRGLVLDREIAFAAYAQQSSYRAAGSFTATLESKGETPLEELVSAWDEEIEALTRQPPSTIEMRGARSRLATENLNQLKDPHFLMRRLLVYSALGDWRVLSRWTDSLAAVDAQDIQEVVRRYLKRERRLVGFYRSDGPKR